jgi:hypothetical protein
MEVAFVSLDSNMVNARDFAYKGLFRIDLLSVDLLLIVCAVPHIYIGV